MINVRGTLADRRCSSIFAGFNIARKSLSFATTRRSTEQFLLNVIASPYFQDRVNETSAASPTRGLTSELARFPCPTTLAEQRRIVAKVDELMALVDALETQLATPASPPRDSMEALVTELTA